MDASRVEGGSAAVDASVLPPSTSKSKSSKSVGLLESLRVYLSMNYFSPLTGMEFKDWWRELKKNRFAVDWPYVPRALIITAASIGNAYSTSLANRKFAREIASAEVAPPVFILGHWRSGTSHLQRLMAMDPRFGYPNFYQVLFPTGFLATEKDCAPIYAVTLPNTRVFDNMSNKFESAAEDEFALCTMTGLSPYMGWSFPNRWAEYDKYLTFRRASADEVAAWEKSFRDFMQRLTVRYRKPIVLKSPPHTARVRLLQRMYPDAKFIHIHRNPYTVYSSTKKMLRTFLQTTRLQKFDENTLDDHIVRTYREMYDAYFEDVARLPRDQFFEVGFEELEQNTLAVMSEMYRKLDLPDFSGMEPALRAYLASVSDYKKNAYQELPTPIRDRLRSEWGRTFESWGYAK